MSKKKLEAWVWVLIYSGILGLSLGWFVEERSPALGWTLLVLGGLGVVSGAALIYLRSRMPP